MTNQFQRQYQIALTVAGSDSCAGAGIQADLKTFAALGCYGVSVITAVTAQNTLGVSAVHPIPPQIITQQLQAVLEDVDTQAVKIGMLFSGDAVLAVAESLEIHNIKNIVLDPVMAAQSGSRLLEKGALKALRACLMPKCLLITPNLPEAEVLLGHPIESLEEIQSAAVEISEMGPANVLIKGGHSMNCPSRDVLYLSDESQFIVLQSEEIQTNNNHGTGCTLSSAIAAHLAQGLNIKAAVRQSKRYITRAIAAGAVYQLGHGPGPVHHFCDYWK